MSRVYSPDWSPDGSRLAFARAVITRWGSTSSIHVIRADGSDRRVVIRSPTGDGSPDWSPDGRSIAFDRQDSAGKEPTAIHIMNADGTRARELSSGMYDYAPAWSPDGRRIAYTQFDPHDFFDGLSMGIYLLPPTGGRETRVTPRGLLAKSPSWAPDGQRLAIEVENARIRGRDEIYTINADGTGMRRLTRNRIDDIDPVWRPRVDGH